MIVKNRSLFVFVFLITILFLLYYIYNKNISEVLPKEKSEEQTEQALILIQGSSMSPALKNGQKYLAEKIENFEGLQNGDIVVFNILGSETPYIKRLFTKPGDSITFDEDLLVINNKDKYQFDCREKTNNRLCKQISEKCGDDFKECFIPVGNCLVKGDATSSDDSFTFGFLSCSKIKWKLIY